MLTFGTDNWITYGWGPTMQEEWAPGKALTIEYAELSESIHPIHAAIAAVKRITETYPAPYSLMCSGGLDSQAMIWAWHLSGVPFNIVAVRYKSTGVSFNDYDLTTLEAFSKFHNFSVKYLDFDLISFLENDLSSVAHENDCDSPQICTHIKMSELIEEGTICYGGNVLYSGRPPITYTLLGMHRYAIRVDSLSRRIIPFFLLHDQKFANSFKTIEGNWDEIYGKNGFPVISPPKKYNGFEQIKEFYDKYKERTPANVRLRYVDKPSRRVFDLLFRYPYEGVGHEYKDMIWPNVVFNKRIV